MSGRVILKAGEDLNNDQEDLGDAIFMAWAYHNGEEDLDLEDFVSAAMYSMPTKWLIRKIKQIKEARGEA